MSTKEDFQKGKLFGVILRFSIPAALSLLITAVYNIVDRIFVGNFNGTSRWPVCRSVFRCPL